MFAKITKSSNFAIHYSKDKVLDYLFNSNASL